MALELQTVQSNDQLIQCVATFNRDAMKHPDRTRSILTHTTYYSPACLASDARTGVVWQWQLCPASTLAPRDREA